MAIELPKQIATYFAADRAGAPHAVAECFTAGAMVRDDGKNHTGHAAIRAWKADSDAKYTAVAEPVAHSAKGGQTIVTARVTGNFPGSPVDLRYAFSLTDEKIAALEITL